MNKQPRYVKVYGDVELCNAVLRRLRALGYKWVWPGDLDFSFSVLEIGIDCQFIGDVQYVSHIVRENFYVDKYNATELPLSELFDGTFPTHVEEKPKPTKVRVWREGVEDDPDVVLVRLLSRNHGEYVSFSVVHCDGEPKHNGSLLRLSTSGIRRGCLVPKDLGIAVNDYGHVEDITEGVKDE